MARTELAVTFRKPNNSVVKPAGVTGTVDGHFIDCHKRTKINDDVRPEKLTLTVTIATATTDVTLKAGDGPQAIDAVYGDLKLTLPVGTHELGPFESGRFMRKGSQLWLDYQTPANVTIAALYAPPVA